LLLSETFVVMHWNVGNSMTKRTNIHKCYTADLILFRFVQIGHLEKLSWSSSTLHASLFQIHYLIIS